MPILYPATSAIVVGQSPLGMCTGCEVKAIASAQTPVLIARIVNSAMLLLLAMLLLRKTGTSSLTIFFGLLSNLCWSSDDN